MRIFPHWLVGLRLGGRERRKRNFWGGESLGLASNEHIRHTRFFYSLLSFDHLRSREAGPHKATRKYARKTTDEKRPQRKVASRKEKRTQRDERCKTNEYHLVTQINTYDRTADLCCFWELDDVMLGRTAAYTRLRAFLAGGDDAEAAGQGRRERYFLDRFAIDPWTSGASDTGAKVWARPSSLWARIEPTAVLEQDFVQLTEKRFVARAGVGSRAPACGPDISRRRSPSRLGRCFSARPKTRPSANG